MLENENMSFAQSLFATIQDVLSHRDPSTQFSAEIVELFTQRAAHDSFPHLFRAYATHPLFEIFETARQRSRFAMTPHLDPVLIDAAAQTHGETDPRQPFTGSVRVKETCELDTLELVTEKTIQARRLVAELYCRDPQKVALADLLIPAALYPNERPDHTQLTFMHAKQQDYHNASRDTRIGSRFFDRETPLDHFLQLIARDVVATRRKIHRRILEGIAKQEQGKVVISCQDLAAGYGSVAGYFAFLETTSSCNRKLSPRYTLGDESFAALKASLPQIMTPDSLKLQGPLGKRVSLPLLSIFGGTAGLERAVHHYVTQEIFGSIHLPYLYAPHSNTDGSHVAQLLMKVINPNEKLARNFASEHIGTLQDLESLLQRRLAKYPQALVLGLNALTFMDAKTLATTLAGLGRSCKKEDYLAVTVAARSATQPEFYQGMPFLEAIRDDFLYLHPQERAALEPICDVRRGDLGELIYQMGFRARNEMRLLDPHSNKRHRVAQGTTIYVHDSVRHCQESLEFVAAQSQLDAYGSANDPVVVFGKTAR